MEHKEPGLPAGRHEENTKNTKYLYGFLFFAKKCKIFNCTKISVVLFKL
jgi:hypothetical protein